MKKSVVAIVMLVVTISSFAQASDEYKRVFSTIALVGECEHKTAPAGWTFAELRYQMEHIVISPNGAGQGYDGAARQKMAQVIGYTESTISKENEIYRVTDKRGVVKTAMEECAEFREKLIQLKNRVK